MDTLIQPHVLVLDPDPAIRTLLAAVLYRSGIRVTTCGRDHDALACCQRRARYEAVILSTDMPRFDTLLSELRLPSPTRRPRIILATTSEAPDDIADADVVLWKPFYLSELHAAIAACCTPCDDERARTRRETTAAPDARA